MKTHALSIASLALVAPPPRPNTLWDPMLNPAAMMMAPMNMLAPMLSAPMAMINPATMINPRRC